MRRKSGVAPTDVPERTELVLVDLAASEVALSEIERDTPRLSSEDEDRLARVADDAARAERRAAHIALRIMLERFAGPGIRKLPYRIGAHGKPILDAAPHFSLSHTKSRALIVVSTLGPIGVDLEHHRSPRIMGERRLAIERAGVELTGGAPLPSHDRDARFLTAWVRLEAVAKADGAGLGAHLSIILGRRSQRASEPGRSPSRDVMARDVPVPPGFYAAIAGPAGLNVPECLAFPSERPAIEATLQENARGHGTRR